MRPYLKLFTHNGLFHADDVVATALLSIMCDDFEVVRGGDEDVPTDPDWIVYDIGGGELDHHTPENKENNGCHPNTDIPYAACGLVWKKYHEEILEALDCPEDMIGKVYRAFETSVVYGIDGRDNGFDNVLSELDTMPNIPQDQKDRILKASQKEFTITALVKDYNPSWNSEVSPDEAFMDAVYMAKDIVVNRLDNIIEGMLGRDFVMRSLDYTTGHVMILKQFAPWQGVIASESKHNQKAKDIWYVISPALRGGYSIQCVLENMNDRTSYRHPFPTEWYGLRDEELVKVCGIDGAVFVHASGFLANTQTLEQAIDMADKAVRA